MAFQIKQYEDIVNDIVKRLLDNNINITDLNESSILRQLVETYSLELESEEFTGLYQKIKEVYDATRISTAVNSDLDEIGKLVGVTRKAGTKATNTITLARNTVAATDFIILEGTIISTQPEGETETLRFSSLVDTTFQKTVIDETQMFVDGIYDYKLTQRFLSTISTVTGIFSTVETAMIENTDFEIIKRFNGYIIDVSTINALDTCEVTTDWTASTDATAVSLDVINKRQGINSLKAGKSGTTEATASYSKTYVTGVNLTGKNPNMKIRIADQATLDKLTGLEVHLGDSSVNYLIFTISKSLLSVGWNNLNLDTDTASSQGVPQIGDIKYINIDFKTITASTTITSGLLNFDYIIFADETAYVGDIIRIIDTGTLPDNNTNLKYTFEPLSVEVDCESADIGVKYNVTIGKLTYKVSSLPNIVLSYNYEISSNGTDIETDSALRTRITNSTAGLGKATVDAIQTAVNGLSFVRSAAVDDMPTKNNTENNTYLTGTLSYKLDHEVAQQDTELKVTTSRSTLNGGIDDSVTTVAVVDGSVYSAVGYVIIDDEIIQYTGVSINDLTGCTRGSESSVAILHTTATEVYQWYKPDDDFTINTVSEFIWTGTGNLPNNSEVFTTYYQYRWLGHITVAAIGPYTFTTQQNIEVTDLIEDIKAAGIAYTYTTPTTIGINVTADIKIKSGFSFSIVQAAVVSALTSKLESYNIGDDVYTSQLIDSIMNVDGVDYTTITTPSTTTVISASEVAKTGTIIINQI